MNVGWKIKRDSPFHLFVVAMNDGEASSGAPFGHVLHIPTDKYVVYDKTVPASYNETPQPLSTLGNLATVHCNNRLDGNRRMKEAKYRQLNPTTKPEAANLVNNTWKGRAWDTPLRIAPEGAIKSYKHDILGYEYYVWDDKYSTITSDKQGLNKFTPYSIERAERFKDDWGTYYRWSDETMARGSEQSGYYEIPEDDVVNEIEQRINPEDGTVYYYSPTKRGNYMREWDKETLMYIYRNYKFKPRDSSPHAASGSSTSKPKSRSRSSSPRPPFAASGSSTSKPEPEPKDGGKRSKDKKSSKRLPGYKIG